MLHFESKFPKSEMQHLTRGFHTLILIFVFYRIFHILTPIFILQHRFSHFNTDSIRGSSNKRPVAALREMVSFLRNEPGKDVFITPDGPRGPVYKMESGLLKLSQWTKVPVLPMRVSYSKAIKLKTWDGFRIPLPFSRVDVTLEQSQSFEGVTDRKSLEEQRLALEELLKSGA